MTPRGIKGAVELIHRSAQEMLCFRQLRRCTLTGAFYSNVIDGIEAAHTG